MSAETQQSSTPTETVSESRSGLQKFLTGDLPASFVTFLVAVPLSLGIALASNAPVMAGLIAAIVGGMVVGALAGAPLQVSGPAAGLVVMVFALTEQLGDWRMVCAVIAMAGVVQVILGAVGVARVALAISPAVVHGMLAGIGILIALSQIHVVLGGTPQSNAVANLRDLPGQIRDLHFGSVGLGVLAIAILIVWPRLPWRRVRSIPAPLVAVVGVTLIAVALSVDAATVDLRADDHVHPVQAGQVMPDGPNSRVGDEGSIWAAISLPVWPEKLGWAGILKAVIALALIASVESLLSAVATDKLHGGDRADLNRELAAQGLGNTVSGLLGGLPVTGVIVRSSANVDAGATTRASAMLHGVWILIFVALFPFLLESIPKAVLAALLVLIGARLVKVNHARTLKNHGELPIYLITTAGVVAIDLLWGVAIGFACALCSLLWRLGHIEIALEEIALEEAAPPSPGSEAGIWRVEVKGALSFLGVPRLSEALGRVPAGAVVYLDLAVDSIDHAGWEAIEDWQQVHERTGGTLVLEGLKEIWAPHRSKTLEIARANMHSGAA